MVIRAYPRGRGGTRIGHQGFDGRQGLSPRTRGNPVPCAATAACPGPIPADAGEPWVEHRHRAKSGAYPRGRGGTGFSYATDATQWGLSPRTRGNPHRNEVQQARHGPIPADAGEPRPGPPAPAAVRAHPRGRGGTPLPSLLQRRHAGLSPRTRGNRDQRRLCRHPPGPIPADAGEPPPITRSSVAARAYPRGRGGTDDQEVRTKLTAGLSPRTRGNRHLLVGADVIDGPIPADAGEPASRNCFAARTRAYPRGRGGTGQ